MAQIPSQFCYLVMLWPRIYGMALDKEHRYAAARRHTFRIGGTLTF